MDWCCAVFWALIDFNVYDIPGTLDNRISLTCLRIRTELWDFYKRWKREHPMEDLTQLENFTPGMLGKNAQRALSFKAMETKQVMPFCAELLHKFAGPLGPLGTQLRSIGAALLEYMSLLRRSQFVVPPATVQTMFDLWNRIYRLWESADLRVKPKLHQTMHMCERSQWQGNPAAYATWVDEGLNKVLANLAKRAHRSVWELRILAYFDESRKRAAKKRRF